MIDDKSIDIVLTSPPYNTGRNHGKMENHEVRYDIYIEHRDIEEYSNWTVSLFNEFTVADCIIWKKKSALPNNSSSNKLTRICEYIFVLCRKDEYQTFKCNKKVKSYSKTGQKYYENIFNFIEAKNNDGSCSLNKATFSSELVEKLLDIYSTSDNDIVLDPFMGTGTTAVGCKNRNKHFIGFELSSAQVEYANKRLGIEDKFSDLD